MTRRALDLRRVLGILAVIAASSACDGTSSDAEADGGSHQTEPGHDGGLKPLSPCLVSTSTAEISVGGIDRVDILFVVDDSGSMAEEQAALAAQFPRLIGALATGDLDGDGNAEASPVNDLHLGVVSGDLGLVGVSDIDKCSGLGHDGVLNNLPGANPAICSQPSYPRFLTFSAGTSGVDATAADLACIATLGTDGCLFQQPLESGLKALWPSDDPRVTFLPDPQGLGAIGQGDAIMGGTPGMNAGFSSADPARPSSLIAVVVVTDGEDCSMKDTSHLTPPSFLDPNDPADAQLLMQGLRLRCHFNPQNLYVKERYINGLRALRPGHEQLVVFAAIVGVPPEIVASPPEDFATNPAARDAFYRAIYDDPRMQPVVDTKGTPDASDDGLQPSCNTTMGTAEPPLRVVQIAEGFGENGLVQSICQEDLAPAIDALARTITRQLGDVCLPRPLIRDAEGKVGCDVVWELPLPERAPSGTPTGCSGAPYLLPVAEGQEGRTLEGAARCRIPQLAVLTDGSGVRSAVPSETDGVVFSDGWYYDDFSEDTQRCSSLPKQRIAFTPEADPPPGVRVVLECANQVASGWSAPPAASTTVEQPALGDACDGVLRNGQLQSGDAACAIRLQNGDLDTSLFCHPTQHVCAQSCASDADCPPAWVCDERPDTLDETGGRATCIAAGCGLGAESASAQHVGDACLPFAPPPIGGYDPREAYVETTNPDCGGGLCLVYQLAGDPSPGCIPESSTETHRCASREDVADSVYCSCRCDAPDGYATCECPDGFSCVNALPRGADDVRGGYCVRNSTITR